MRFLFALFCGFVLPFSSFAAEKGLSDTISIIRLADGTYSVLCADHRQEIVTEANLRANQLCLPLPAPGAQKTDFLFIVDNSASMQDRQRELADAGDALVSRMIANNEDFRIAVITTDTYTTGPRYRFSTRPDLFLTPNTPNLIGAVRTSIMQGTNGDGDERAFESMRLALTSVENQSFLRPDAFLRIIIIGDEDDQSVSQTRQPIPVEDYFAFLNQLRGYPAPLNFSVTAISNFDAASCPSQVGNPSGPTAARFLRLVEITGGQALSICEPIRL